MMLKMKETYNITRVYLHALRKPDPGELSSLENLEQTEILVDQDT